MTALAIGLALSLGALWLLIVVAACIATGGNRQPETPGDVRRDRDGGGL